MKRPRRPSPALVVGIIAVVLASTGSAVAARAITSKDIRNGTIKVEDLSAAARQALAGSRGPQGPPGATGATGATGPAGAAGAPGQNATLFAAGDANGSLQRSSGGVTVNKFGTGLYRLTFPANISNCVAVASIGATTAGNNVASGGAGATVNPSLGNGVMTVLTSDGTTTVDKPWAVGIFC